MAPHLAYDQASGQVYTEVVVSASAPRNWWHNCTGKPEDPFTHRRLGKGTSSLYDAALRVCTFNADLLTPEALQCAEWPYAERIYKRLKDRDAFTFKLWKIFQAAFPNSIELSHTYCVHIKSNTNTVATTYAPLAFPSEMSSIQRQLTSLPFASLSNLNLLNLRLRHTHLMDLLNLPNLAVLALEQDVTQARARDDGGIDNRFMKRWGLEISKKKAFTKLRVLMLRHFQTALEDTFLGLTAFPQLLLCNLDSWFAKQDMIGMKSGGAVPRRGRWRHLPTDGGGAQGRGKNPQTIWVRTDKTIHERMTMLYDLAGLLHERPRTDPSSNAIISIQYGDGPHRNSKKSYSAWFVRVPVSTAEHLQQSKRPSDLEENAKKDDASKKRKVRAGKQNDIGSLLGTFC